MDEKLLSINEKVCAANTGHLFTPEQLFVQYVGYYGKEDKIEIEPEVLENLIDCFFEDGSASIDYFPIHTLELENLTKEEYDYFYQELSDVFKKIYDATDKKWLKELIEFLLDLK